MSDANSQTCRIDTVQSLSLWGSLKSLLWYILPISFPFILYRHLGGFQKPVGISRKLKGQVVLITGASSGLGEAYAHVFYKAGCKVILASRRLDELQRVKETLLQIKQTTTSYPPEILQLDLVDLKSIPAQAEKALAFHGHIDIIINNAGISHRGGILHTNVDVDIRIMTVNYFGQITLTKAILPSMVSRRRGHVVAISSIQGLIAIPYRSAYSASKHAFNAFCDSLRAEVAPHNIKVSIISPGYVRTKLSENALEGDGSTHGRLDKSTAEGYSPEYVAMRTFESIIAEEPERVISTFLPRLAIFLRNFWPSLYFRIMENRAKGMREELQERH